MINTSQRRLEMIKWLKDNNPSEFFEPLKLQKYLFFYELFSKANDQDYSLEYLRGYKNGPVFGEVYGDYTYRKDELIPKLQDTEIQNLDIELAQKASFLITILNKEELSELTHEMNIWKEKEEDILKGEPHVALKEEYLSFEDMGMVEELMNMYSVDTIRTVRIVSIKDKNFLFSDEDFNSLTEQQKEVLELLSEEDLENPVYVSIGEEGELLID